jgi:hypothetical protein
MNNFKEKHQNFWEENKDLNQTNIARLDLQLKLIKVLEESLIKSRKWGYHRVFVADVVQVIDQQLKELKSSGGILWSGGGYAEDFLDEILWPKHMTENTLLAESRKTPKQLELENKTIVSALIILSDNLTQDLERYKLFFRQIRVLEALYEINFEDDSNNENEKVTDQKVDPSISQ